MVPGQFVVRTIRRRTILRGQLVADNSSQSVILIFRKNCFHFSNIPFINPASTSATLFSSLSLPFQLHFFHHSLFHFSYTFSSLPLPLQQYLFHLSHFHFCNILLINPASISATLFSSLGPSIKYITLEGGGVREGMTVCDRQKGVKSI